MHFYEYFFFHHLPPEKWHFWIKLYPSPSISAAFHIFFIVPFILIVVFREEFLFFWWHSSNLFISLFVSLHNHESRRKNSTYATTKYERYLVGWIFGVSLILVVVRWNCGRGEVSWINVILKRCTIAFLETYNCEPWSCYSCYSILIVFCSKL